MQVIILAGGLGTRLSEETIAIPKPMVKIGDKPILQHIMEIYFSQGIEEFIIAGGYKYDRIRDWLDFQPLPWKATLVDTGETSQTAERISRCLEYITGDRFMVTYGDGLGNVRIHELIRHHLSHQKIATLTAVRPIARFGVVKIIDGQVKQFVEKSQTEEGWINGGFFVFDKAVTEFLIPENPVLEKHVLPKLSRLGELSAYKHRGFWHPMDTLRDKNYLEELIKMSPSLPWLVQ